MKSHHWRFHFCIAGTLRGSPYEESHKWQITKGVELVGYRTERIAIITLDWEVRLVWLRCLFLAQLVLTKTEVAEKSICSDTILSSYVWAILVTQDVVDRKVNIEKYLSRQIIKSPMGPPIRTFQSPIKAFYGPISNFGTILEIWERKAWVRIQVLRWFWQQGLAMSFVV